MNNDPRGIMIIQGNLIFINNALIEEVSCSNDFFSELLISYAVRENNSTSIQTIRLNLNQKTLVLDASGQNICLCCLRPGMWINAVISSQMTRSNPPQANAFLVAIQKTPQSSMPPERPTPLPQPMPPQRPTPPPPMSPQRPTPRTPSLRPQPRSQQNSPQNTSPSQMQNQSENSNFPQTLDWNQNSNSPQIPTRNSNSNLSNPLNWM